ncbi:MAG: Ribose 5-phosphate isomerase B, partial [uncultured Frankineae bacterium]
AGRDRGRPQRGRPQDPAGRLAHRRRPRGGGPRHARRARGGRLPAAVRCGLRARRRGGRRPGRRRRRRRVGRDDRLQQGAWHPRRPVPQHLGRRDRGRQQRRERAGPRRQGGLGRAGGAAARDLAQHAVQGGRARAAPRHDRRPRARRAADL